MAYIKWTVTILIWLLVAAFLHYTLPRWDVVVISNTESKRERPADVPLFWSSANPPTEVRDVYYIQAQTEGRKVRVYRNEDTGYGWPPFFKFNTSDLQAEAAGLTSTIANPTWVAVKHYGWRVNLISIYPNVLRIKEVSGPDVRIIPWTSIVILVALAAAFWALRVRWVRFREARLDPVFERVDDRLDDSAHWIKRLLGRG